VRFVKGYRCVEAGAGRSDLCEGLIEKKEERCNKNRDSLLLLVRSRHIGGEGDLRSRIGGSSEHAACQGCSKTSGRCAGAPGNEASRGMMALPVVLSSVVEKKKTKKTNAVTYRRWRGW